METPDMSRRTMLATAAIAVGAGGAVLPTPAPAQADNSPMIDPMKPVPIPAQVPAKEGLAELDDTRLWYWDTGGNGPAIVLLHEGFGSSDGWLYQQPVFAKAGYRVVAYSRRGYHNSDPESKDNPGYGSGDLHQLVNFLGIGKFHVVATAAGCAYAIDYALTYADRLYSMTLASPAGTNVKDDEFSRRTRALLPKGFDDMPTLFREVGPSYRYANPEGARLWADLSNKAITGYRAGTKLVNVITWDRLQEMRAPTLLVAGDADLYAPPSTLREYAAHIPNCSFVAISESGHAIYWEQPESFNRAVLAFIDKYKG